MENRWKNKNRVCFCGSRLKLTVLFCLDYFIDKQNAEVITDGCWASGPTFPKGLRAHASKGGVRVFFLFFLLLRICVRN